MLLHPEEQSVTVSSYSVKLRGEVGTATSDMMTIGELILIPALFC